MRTCSSAGGMLSPHLCARSPAHHLPVSWDRSSARRFLLPGLEWLSPRAAAAKMPCEQRREVIGPVAVRGWGRRGWGLRCGRRTHFQSRWGRGSRGSCLGRSGHWCAVALQFCAEAFQVRLQGGHAVERDKREATGK